MLNRMQAVLALLTTVNAGYVRVAMNQVTSSQPYGEGDVLFDQISRDTATPYVLPEMVIDQFKSYVAVLHIGSNHQLVTPFIDTSTSNTWLMSIDNPLCQGTEFDCTGKIFDDKSSSTSHYLGDDRTVSYRDGSFATGVQMKDDIILDDGTTIEGAEFLLAKTATSNGTVLGLGLYDTLVPPQILVNETYNGNIQARRASEPDQEGGLNFPAHIKNQGLISRMAYSMFMNDPETNAGEIMFGAVDHSKYVGELGLMPMIFFGKRSIAQPGLRVMLNGIGVRKGEQSCGVLDFAIPFVLDSSTSYAIMPNDIVAQMAKVMGFERRGIFYGGNCDGPFMFDTFELDFMGLKLQVPPKSLMVQEMDQYGYWREINGEKQCYMAILSTEDSRIAILGDIFMSNFYVVYDLESSEVAMAQANFGAKSKQVEEIKSSIPSASPVRLYAATARRELTFLEFGTCFASSASVSSPTTSISSEAITSSSSVAIASTFAASTPAVSSLTFTGNKPNKAKFRSSYRMQSQTPSVLTSPSQTADQLAHPSTVNATFLESAEEVATKRNETANILPPVKYTAKPSFHGNGHHGSEKNHTKHPHDSHHTEKPHHDKPEHDKPEHSKTHHDKPEHSKTHHDKPEHNKTHHDKPEHSKTNEKGPHHIRNATKPFLQTEAADDNRHHFFNKTKIYLTPTATASSAAFDDTPAVPARHTSSEEHHKIRHPPPAMKSTLKLSNDTLSSNDTFGLNDTFSLNVTSGNPMVQPTADPTRSNLTVLLNTTISRRTPKVKPTHNHHNTSAAQQTATPFAQFNGTSTNLTTSAVGEYNVSSYNATSSPVEHFRANISHAATKPLRNATSTPVEHFRANISHAATKPLRNATSTPVEHFRANISHAMTKPVRNHNATTTVDRQMTTEVAKNGTHRSNFTTSALSQMLNLTSLIPKATPQTALNSALSLAASNTTTIAAVFTPTLAPHKDNASAILLNMTEKTPTFAIHNQTNAPSMVKSVETAVMEVPIQNGETTVHILTTIDVTQYVNYTVHLPRPTSGAKNTSTQPRPLRTITKVPLSQLLTSPTPAATTSPRPCSMPEGACTIYTVSYSTFFTTVLNVCDAERFSGMDAACLKTLTQI